MAKKKEIREPIEVDFEKVFEEVREPEGMRMSNIFQELRYEAKPQEDSVSCYWEQRHVYYEYLEWLRKQGVKDTDFFVGRDLNYYGGYKKW